MSKMQMVEADGQNIDGPGQVAIVSEVLYICLMK